MVDARKIKPGFWYVRSRPSDSSAYTIILVQDDGIVLEVGSEAVREVSEWEFIAPVPVPPTE